MKHTSGVGAVISAFCLSLAVAAFAIVACDSSPTPAPIPATVTVSPGDPADLTATARQALVCNTGALTWTIQEGAIGGTIVAGVYTAPSCGPTFIAGTYHVLASGCGRVTSIPIDVTERILSVALICAIPQGETVCQDPSAGIEVEVGHTAQFYARVGATCSSVVVPPIPAGACQAAFCQ